jgi:hypothetical protein
MTNLVPSQLWNKIISWLNLEPKKSPQIIMFNYEIQFARMDKICSERGNSIQWSFGRSLRKDDSFCVTFTYSANGYYRKGFCGREVDRIFDDAEEWFTKYDKSSLV